MVCNETGSHSIRRTLGTPLNAPDARPLYQSGLTRKVAYRIALIRSLAVCE
jgi:hypothetical protein